MSGVAPVPAGSGVVYAKKTKVQPILNQETAIALGTEDGISMTKVTQEEGTEADPSSKPQENGKLSQEELKEEKISIADSRTKGNPDKNSKATGIKEEEKGLIKVKPQLKKVENENFTRSVVVSEADDKPPTLIALIPKDPPMETRPRGGRQMLKCPECDQTFPNKITLDVHMCTHKEEERFACAHCPKVFRWKQSWKNHVRTHQKAYEPFKCTKCQKEFVIRSSWFNHTRLDACIAVPPALKEIEDSSSHEKPESPSPIVSPSRGKRQSVSQTLSQPQIKEGKKHQIEQSGLPIKKRGRPAKIVMVKRPASFSSETGNNKIRPEFVNESEEQDYSDIDDATESSASITSVSEVEFSPTFNGISASSVKTETITDSPETSSRVQRKRNPPKWTENMVMDYELPYAKVQSQRSHRASGSRKSSVESSLTDVSPVGRNRDPQNKPEYSTDDEIPITKNSQNFIEAKNGNSKNIGVGNKGSIVGNFTGTMTKDIPSLKEKRDDSKKKLEGSKKLHVDKNEELENVILPNIVDAKKVLRCKVTQVRVTKTTEIPLNSDLNGSSGEKNGIPAQEVVELKSEPSSETKTALYAKFDEAIRSSKIAQNKVPQETDVIKEKVISPPQNKRGRKRRKGKSKKTGLVVPNKKPCSEKVLIETDIIDAKRNRKDGIVVSVGPDNIFRISGLKPNQRKEDDLNTHTPITSNSVKSMDEDVPDIPIEKNSPKRGRPRAVQPELTSNLEYPLPKTDLQQPVIEKIPSSLPTEPSLSTSADLNPALGTTPDNPGNTPSTSNGTTARFCGMPRLLNQSSVLPTEFAGGSDKSSDSDDDPAFANGDFVSPPGSRRLSTEPYIKDEVMRFLANKISNRNMLRIRQELMLLKQSGNYFKLTKTAPLAAGLIHDMFCQTLEP